LRGQIQSYILPLSNILCWMQWLFLTSFSWTSISVY